MTGALNARPVIGHYFGCKSAPGLIRGLLSLMPSHDVYCEPFVGGGSVLAAKLPSATTLVADIDPRVIGAHRSSPVDGGLYLCAGWRETLESLASVDGRRLCYCDPPYHPSTRGRRRYRYDMTAADHAELLSALLAVTYSVMLSGYRCREYDEALSGWHRSDFRIMTRGGPRVESVWCNFTPGSGGWHDLRFQGSGFRERERVKRKRARWVARLARMPAWERAVLIAALGEGIPAPPTAGAGDPAGAAAAVPPYTLDLP